MGTVPVSPIFSFFIFEVNWITLTFASTATADKTIVANDNNSKGCLIVGGQDSNVTISNGTIVNEITDDSKVYAVVGTKDVI